MRRGRDRSLKDWVLVLLAGAVASPLFAADPAVFAKAGQEIVLATGEGSAATLKAPPGAARLRREPLPLVEDGRLAGLVWLEGVDTRSLAVRAARWNGAGWEKLQTISPPGPGSQLALTAARLADGSWLLAWSAFDGHDDEIVWSRQGDPAGTGTWSAPTRVAPDNDVPDITPALVATPDGALLAWSRFDPEGGGYRVVTARFRAGRWEAPHVVSPVGALFPRFAAAPGTGVAGGSGGWLLLYQNAARRDWVGVELDAAGWIRP